MKSRLLILLTLSYVFIATLCQSVGAQDKDKFMFGGYIDWTFTAYEAGMKPSSFDAFHFNPIFLFQIEDNILASSEIEFEHGGDEIIVEYAQIDYLWNDYLTFTFGKFLTPFGAFNRRLHPTWISRVPGKPLSNYQVIPTGWSEVGVMVSGAVGIGQNGGRVNYAFYVGNGLEGEAGGSLRSLRKEADPREENNSSKALGGRIGIVPAASFEFGLSGYTGKYDAVADPMLNLNMVGADGEYHYQDVFELRGEYNQADQEVAPGQYTIKRGYYAQAALKLSITDNDLLMPVELALRFSGQNFAGKDNDISEITPTVNYHFSPTAIMRLGYRINIESQDKTPNNSFVVLLTKGL